MNNRCGNALGPIIVLIAVVVIVIYVIMQSSAGSGGVSAHIPDYMTMLDDGRNFTASNAQAEGPAVIVDYEMKRIDELSDKLPHNLVAEMHADVKTVIVLVRGSSGIPSSVGMTIASSNSGHYNIGAFVFDAQGTLLKSHSVNKTGAMSGAGEEAELHAAANREMLDWITKTLGG